MGMVLSAVPIGEYDKRVVILTRERGKISAFARGARKPGNALSGVINPFSFGEFTVYEGLTSYTLLSASISNYFVEIASYYCREANDEREMLKLLYQTMRALINEKIPNRLIRYIYELKAICINGEAPQVFQCVVCGDKERPGKFSTLKGGKVCTHCIRDVYDGLELDPSTWYTLQYIESAKVEHLYNFTVSDLVLRELAMVMGRYMDVYVDHQFKSLEILKLMT